VGCDSARSLCSLQRASKELGKQVPGEKALPNNKDCRLILISLNDFSIHIFPIIIVLQGACPSISLSSHARTMRLNNVRSGCLQTYKTALPLQKSWSHVRVCSSNQNLLQLSSKQPSLRVLAHGSAYVSGLGGNGGGNGNNTNQVTRIGDGDSGSSWGRSGALQVLQRLLQALAGWLVRLMLQCEG